MPFSNESIFAEYKKAIPELTISNEERQKIILEQKNKKLSELEERNARLDKLEQYVMKQIAKEEAIERNARQFHDDIKKGLREEIKKKWLEEEKNAVPYDDKEEIERLKKLLD